MSTADTAERLRGLAAAASTVNAPSDLARVVLDRARRRRRARLVATGVGGVVLAGALAASTLLGRSDFVTAHQPSTAMEPTIHVGERVVMSRSATPGRGDVVVVHLLRDGHPYDAIFRVAALSGQTVGCPPAADGRCRSVVVDGVPVPEPFLGAVVTDPFPVTTVGAGTLFLLGDNRSVAYDSRRFGPVDQRAVRGVVVRIVDREGVSRPVPGAPPRAGPGERDNVDPAGTLPPPAVSVPE
jgi:signal peptidase I